MINVLLVEDDLELSDILVEFLRGFDIQAVTTDDPYKVMALLSMHKIDVIILDLTLPGMDGLELLPKIRERYQIPVIISSARSDITDKIVGFERGADDYLPKPYNPRELEARIKTILKRAQGQTTISPTQETPKEVVLDEDKMEISRLGEVLSLTHAEYGILSYMIKNSGRVISREEFLEEVDALDSEGSFKTIDVMMVRIRNKLKERSKEPRHIISVRGVGFKFVN
jgi:two-component system OmpR family response regulator